MQSFLDTSRRGTAPFTTTKLESTPAAIVIFRDTPGDNTAFPTHFLYETRRPGQGKPLDGRKSRTIDSCSYVLGSMSASAPWGILTTRSAPPHCFCRAAHRRLAAWKRSLLGGVSKVVVMRLKGLAVAFYYEGHLTLRGSPSDNGAKQSPTEWVGMTN